MFITKLLFIIYYLTLYFSWVSYNPVLICVSLIFLSLITGIVFSTVISKWMMLSILLIFLGGMMVMFIYVTALSANQKFFWPESSFLFWSILLLTLSFAMILEVPALSMSSMKEMFFISYSIMLLILLVLLVTLLISVKLVESFKGAMKFFVA